MPGPRHIIIAAAAWLCLQGSATAADPLEQTHVQARQTVRQVMQEQRIPGLQLAIVKDGRIVLSESYGLANVENRVPATRSTLFPINSATKPFTGVALMQLAEDGLVDLDAPISRYLDDLPETWRSVRVRQLLAHTSGLPDIIGPRGLIGGGNEAEAWKAVKALPLEAPVGERYAYNQTNYGLLAQIIARVSKQPYAGFIAERQFAKVGMPAATFGDSYDLVPNAATIYTLAPRGSLAPGDKDRLSRVAYDIPYSLWSGGSLQTTADEVAHWLIALSDGRLLGKASLGQMWTPEKLNNGTDSTWGAGWPVLQTSPERQVAGIGGARAAFIVYPDQQLAVVVLTNLAGANPQKFIPRIAELYR